MVMVRKNGGCCEAEDVLASPIRNGCRSHIIVSRQRSHESHWGGGWIKWKGRTEVLFLRLRDIRNDCCLALHQHMESMGI
jgi:hypothetical protein